MISKSKIYDTHVSKTKKGQNLLAVFDQDTNCVPKYQSFCQMYILIKDPWIKQLENKSDI